MPFIQPFGFIHSTAYKERVELANKLNEVIEKVNTGGSGSTITEIDYETVKTHFDNGVADKMIIAVHSIPKYSYIFYPQSNYSATGGNYLTRTIPPFTEDNVVKARFYMEKLIIDENLKQYIITYTIPTNGYTEFSAVTNENVTAQFKFYLVG